MFINKMVTQRKDTKKYGRLRPGSLAGRTTLHRSREWKGCTAAEAGSSDKSEYKINQGTENDSNDRGKQKCHYGPADTSCFLLLVRQVVEQGQ